jgi:hypothetical protein
MARSRLVTDADAAHERRYVSSLDAREESWVSAAADLRTCMPDYEPVAGGGAFSEVELCVWVELPQPFGVVPDSQADGGTPYAATGHGGDERGAAVAGVGGVGPEGAEVDCEPDPWPAHEARVRSSVQASCSPALELDRGLGCCCSPEVHTADARVAADDVGEPSVRGAGEPYGGREDGDAERDDPEDGIPAHRRIMPTLVCRYEKEVCGGRQSEGLSSRFPLWSQTCGQGARRHRRRAERLARE